MATCNIELVVEGIEEAKRGNTMLGLKILQDTARNFNLPEAKAWLGYCMAREKTDVSNGLTMCLDALRNNPKCSEIYLALGRVYILAGKRGKAIEILERGYRIDQSPEIDRLLKSIGIRRAPVFRFLSRDNCLNISSGRLLTRMGLR